MDISADGKRVFKRFCIVSLGIPTAFLIFVLIAHFTGWAPERITASSRSLNLVLAGLILAGLAIYFFFSSLIYKRLWKVFPYIGDKDKGWTQAEGVFILLGVGTMMSSALGVFYYIITYDLPRSLILIGLSYLLALLEGVRFPGRIADIEEIIARME